MSSFAKRRVKTCSSQPRTLERTCQSMRTVWARTTCSGLTAPSHCSVLSYSHSHTLAIVTSSHFMYGVRYFTDLSFLGIYIYIYTYSFAFCNLNLVGFCRFYHFLFLLAFLRFFFLSCVLMCIYCAFNACACLYSFYV